MGLLDKLFRKKPARTAGSGSDVGGCGRACGEYCCPDHAGADGGDFNDPIVRVPCGSDLRPGP